MEGSYLCKAKNAAGETEDLVQIVVTEDVSDRGGDGEGNWIFIKKIDQLHTIICKVAYYLLLININVFQITEIQMTESQYAAGPWLHDVCLAPPE